jgi:hypothetical protein
MKVLFILLFIALAFSGCYYDSKENLYPVLNCTDTVNVTYAAKIAPILDSYCNSCHYTGNTNTGNVILDTYDGVKNAVDNQKLYSSIIQDGSVKPMPNSGGKLDDCKIAAFSTWIKAGAPHN